MREEIKGVEAKISAAARGPPKLTRVVHPNPVFNIF
jgi:hypothetical protein